MKDIKSMIIGFLLATCMFLFMGYTSNDSEFGRYQHMTTFTDEANSVDGAIVKTHYVLDTKTENIRRYDSIYYLNSGECLSLVADC